MSPVSSAPLPRSGYQLARWFTGIGLTLLLTGTLLGTMGARSAHAAPLESPDPSQGLWNLSNAGSPTVVQHHPRVYLVFWGPAWSQASGMDAIATIEGTFRVLAGSAYNNILSQYTDTPAEATDLPYLPSGSDYLRDNYIHNDVELMTAPTGAPYQRVIDQSTPPGSIDIGVETPTGVQEHGQIRQEADRMIAAYHWPVNQDSQVIVFPQVGTTYNALSFPGNWCGMHVFNSTAAHHYAYALVQYGDQNGCAETGARLAYTAVHEYSEMATDPVIKGTLSIGPFVGSGWQKPEANTSPQELADLCEDLPAYEYTSVNDPTGPTYLLPPLWSNYAWDNTGQGCVTAQGQEYPSPDTILPFTGKHTLQGDILTHYQQLGGVSSALGEPIRR